MKTDINTMITQAYHISRCSSWKLSSKAWTAYASSKLQRKTMPPKIEFPTLTSDVFLNQINPINKLAMNNRRLLIAAEFQFVHSVEKDS